MIFKRWMALHAAFESTALILLKALGAKRHALVDLAVIADDRGFADHNAGSVVDEE